MKLRVHVRLEHGKAIVRVVRSRWSSPCNEAIVATIRLGDDDAESQIADARAKARQMCKDLNELER
jgi:hypothetical protein